MAKTLTIEDPGYGIDNVTFDIRRADMLAIYLNTDDGRTQALVLDGDQVEQLRQLLTIEAS